jgi:hypothetical protein
LQNGARGGEDSHIRGSREVLPWKHPHEYGRKKIVARTFNLGTKLRPPSLLARAKKAAYDNGATLLGDERSGRFSHDMAKGEYRMAGRTVVVTVAEKHWLLPWPVVEAQLRELVR